MNNEYKNIIKEIILEANIVKVPKDILCLQNQLYINVFYKDILML